MKKQDQADEIIRLLDEMQRVEGDPWLYERVQARLAAQKANEPEALPSGKFKPDWLLWPALCLILLLNGWLLWRPQGQHNSRALQQAMQEYYLNNSPADGIYSY